MVRGKVEGGGETRGVWQSVRGEGGVRGDRRELNYHFSLSSL